MPRVGKLKIDLGGYIMLAELPCRRSRKTGVWYCLGSGEGWHRFDQRLLDLPGAKEWDGPMINGLYAVTFDLIEEPRLTPALMTEMIQACWQYRWENDETWQYVLTNMRANLAMEACRG
jgi:hypothetical protein